MRTVLCVAIAVLLAAVACGDSATNWAESKDYGNLVARGRDVDGREFGVWNDNGKVIRVGWIKDKDEPRDFMTVDQAAGEKILEVIVQDCDADGADDLIVMGETPEKYSRIIVLNGSLLKGSYGQSGFSTEIHGRATGGLEQFIDLDTRCKEAAETFQKLRERVCELARQENPDNLPKECEK